MNPQYRVTGDLSVTRMEIEKEKKNQSASAEHADTKTHTRIILAVYRRWLASPPPPSYICISRPNKSMVNARERDYRI